MSKRVYTEEEKKTFAENAKAKADEAAAMLKAGVQNMYTSGKYAEYLKFYSGLHNYSFGNCILIMSQLPTATICASYADWKKRGRYVKRGEHGLMVRVPTPVKFKKMNADGTEEEHSMLKFKVGAVFDISQTEGDEIPEICNKLTADVSNYTSIKDALINSTTVPIFFEEMEDGKNGYYSRAENKIGIKAGMSESQTIKTMAHEITHSLLHCPGGKMENADKNTKELQAESVAFIVCHYLGIDSSDYSFGYVTSWSAGKSPDELEKNMTVIGQTAQAIIKKIAGEE